jgi:hypothetical protein
VRKGKRRGSGKRVHLFIRRVVRSGSLRDCYEKDRPGNSIDADSKSEEQLAFPRQPARISRDDDDDDEWNDVVRPPVGKSQPLLYLLDPRLRRQMSRWATTRG